MPDIRVNSFDGAAFDAYIAHPHGGNGPGLIVIHEVFGPTANIRAQCDAFAQEGYIALCPNLFWRQPLPSVSQVGTEMEWEQAAQMYKNFDVEASVRDLLASLAYVRRLPGCGGKVGTVGYCLGGRMAYLLATRSDVDCAVSYYGVGIDSYLDEVYDIRSPFLLHLAEQDKLMPPQVRQRILSAMKRNPVIQTQLYAGADHGFAREGGAKYHPEAASLASAKTSAFLKSVLLG